MSTARSAYSPNAFERSAAVRRVAVSAWRTALRVWFAALVRAALALLDFVARVDLRLRAAALPRRAPAPFAAAFEPRRAPRDEVELADGMWRGSPVLACPGRA